jgi:hypothetical protein
MTSKNSSFDKFDRFQSLYCSSRYAGAASILNRSFNFDIGHVVPLSISHGVDFGMCYGAMDVHQPEPIHWAYNDNIYRITKGIKPVIKLPHPWWFVVKDLKVPVGDRLLLIGPPPGKINDERLLAIIKNNYELTQIDVLIKWRGPIDNTISFWNKNNINTVTAGPSDEDFYSRLFEILSRYEIIISPVFSSATIFAASIGKKVIFLKGYMCKFYDTKNYLQVMNFDSEIAKQIVSKFLYGSKSEIMAIAQSLLGFTNEKIDDLKVRYTNLIAETTNPIFLQSHFSPILCEIALRVRRPSIATLNFSKLKAMWSRSEVSELEIDELSVWENGLNDQNFNIRSLKYIRGITEPGRGVDN